MTAPKMAINNILMLQFTLLSHRGNQMREWQVNIAACRIGSVKFNNRWGRYAFYFSPNVQGMPLNALQLSELAGFIRNLNADLPKVE